MTKAAGRSRPPAFPDGAVRRRWGSPIVGTAEPSGNMVVALEAPPVQADAGRDDGARPYQKDGTLFLPSSKRGLLANDERHLGSEHIMSVEVATIPVGWRALRVRAGGVRSS